MTKRAHVKHAVRFVAAAVLCVFLIWWTGPRAFTSTPPAPQPATVYPCLNDEGGDVDQPCFWDAKHMGNGHGRSFFRTKSGRIVYVNHVVAHQALQIGGHR